MPEKPRSHLKDSLKIFGPTIGITIIGFIVAYQFVQPAPPDRLVIGTASREGAYYAFAVRYGEILARHGIGLEIRETQGSVENIELLLAQEGGIDVAFVQGGIRPEHPGGVESPLVSLASLYFEPLWVFLRKGLPVRHIDDLEGKRMAVGAEGSGTRAVALTLLRDNEIDPTRAELLPLGGEDAARALQAGTVDAAFFVAAPSASVVRRLAASSDVEILSFDRADAYARVHRFLSSVRLPEGVINFRRNLPSEDKVLLAATANLVAREELHPALIDLLLQAASEVHGPGGMFEEAGEFPSTQHIDFPLSSDARRYFQYGPPFLRRVLPFWAATLIDRTKVMLLPLIALLFPLFKIMPPAYRWRVRSRIYRWYRELLALDSRIERGRPAHEVKSDIAELDRIENEVKKVSIPLSYADELYTFRLHIDMVREKLQKAASE